MKRISPFVIAIFKIQFLFLILMSFYRIWFYKTYSPHPILPEELYYDLWNALWFGFRLDLSILGYVTVLALLILGVMQSCKALNRTVRQVFIIYFWIVYLIITFLIASDLAFYSYFGEHTNIMIFGVIDDDTSALMDVAVKNYNFPLIFLSGLIYLFILWKTISWIFHQTEVELYPKLPRLWQIFLFVVLITFSFFAARGSFGTFPISKNIVDVSEDVFINKLPQNGVYAFSHAYSLYKKSKQGTYDLIKLMGYDKNIKEAFLVHARSSMINSSNLLASLKHTTSMNPVLEKNPPHVIVVMVESFGLPITEYQSKTFDIMGRLKDHFKRDIVFKNFISASNGTIVSLEPLLLNIAARPNSTSFGQSQYMQTAFTQSAAKVYQAHGYETSFVYGGDLSWRNVGQFIKYQGFDHVEGKATILNTLKVNPVKAMHTWGIFDQYAYDYLLKKLEHAKTPQFIFLLTTNNHPPYTVPSEYVSRPLDWSVEMTKHMIGDKELMKKRLRDYAYALDMAGRFMDSINSNSKFSNTVVVITGDNNTIEYGMKYDDTITSSKLVPFYLHLPSHIRPTEVNTSVAGSHKDIFPTLYNLTLSNADYISTGINLLDENSLHCGFNDLGIVVTNQGAFELGKAKNEMQIRCERYHNATLAVGEYLIHSHDKQMKVKTAH